MCWTQWGGLLGYSYERKMGRFEALESTHGFWRQMVFNNFRFLSSYFSWIHSNLYSVHIFAPKPRRKKWKNRELSTSKLAYMIVELLRWFFRWSVQAKVMLCDLFRVHTGVLCHNTYHVISYAASVWQLMRQNKCR